MASDFDLIGDYEPLDVGASQPVGDIVGDFEPLEPAPVTDQVRKGDYGAEPLPSPKPILTERDKPFMTDPVEVNGRWYTRHKQTGTVHDLQDMSVSDDPAVISATGGKKLTKRAAAQKRADDNLGPAVAGNESVMGKTDVPPTEFQTYSREASKAISKGAVDIIGTALKGFAGITTDNPRKVKEVEDGFANIGTMSDAQFSVFERAIPENMEINPVAALNYQMAARAARRGDQAKAQGYLDTARRHTNLKPLKEQQAYQLGEKVKGSVAGEEFKPRPGWEKSITVQLGQGLGSMVAFVPASLIAGPAGAAALALPAGSGEAVENAEGTLARATRDDRAGPYNAGYGQGAEAATLEAAKLGTMPGATDVIPVETLVQRLPQVIPGLRQVSKTPFWGKFAKAVGQTVAQMAMEGGQEAGQQYLQNLISKITLLPEKDLTEEVLNSFLIGSAVGGIVEAPVAVADAITAPGEQMPPQGPAEAVQPPPVDTVNRAAKADKTSPDLRDPRAAAKIFADAGYTSDDIRSMTPAQMQEALRELTEQGAAPPGMVAPQPPRDDRPPVGEAPFAPRVKQQEQQIRQTQQTQLAPDKPTAEPMGDIAAQVKDLRDPKSKRRAVWLPKASADRVLESDMDLNGAGVPVENFDGEGGVLIAKDERTAKQAVKAREAGRPIQEIVGKLTGAGTGKKPDATTVVQQTDKTGAVIRESVVPEAEVQATQAEFGKNGAPVRVVSPEEALVRRAEGVAADVLRAGNEARAVQDEFLKSRGLTLEEARALPENEKSVLQSEYKAWFAQREEIGKEEAQQPAQTETIGDGTRAKPLRPQDDGDMAVARARVNTEPSEAAKAAENYKAGHVRVAGIDITIESPKGSTRRGKDADGKEWAVEMPADYGRIKRTTGADGDQLDVFIADNLASTKVFVIDQKNLDTNRYDESKAVVGADTSQQAEALYDQSFSDGNGPARRMAITEVTIDEFKHWLNSGNTKQPFSRSATGKKRKRAMVPRVEEDQGISRLAEHKGSLPESEGNTVSRLRGEGDHNSPRVGDQLYVISGAHRADAETGVDRGPQGQREGLHPRKRTVGDETSPEPKSPLPSDDDSVRQDTANLPMVGGTGGSSSPDIQSSGEGTVPRDRPEPKEDAKLARSKEKPSRTVHLIKKPEPDRFTDENLRDIQRSKEWKRFLQTMKEGGQSPPHRESGVAVEMAQGWWDGKAGREPDVTFLEGPEGAIHPYLQGYWAATHNGEFRPLRGSHAKLVLAELAEDKQKPLDDSKQADLVDMARQAERKTGLESLSKLRTAPQAPMDARKRAKVIDLVHQAAHQFLGHRITVHLVDDLGDRAGVYDGRERSVYIAIRSAMESVGTMAHESIHALRDIGVFTKPEWAVLSRWARTNYLPRTNIRELYADRYDRRFVLTPEMLEDLLVEEAVAEAFKEYVTTGRMPTEAPGFIRTLFERIKAFLDKIREIMTGVKARTAEDIFGDILAGEYANRPGGQVPYGRGYPIYLRPLSPSEAVGLEAREMTETEAFKRWFGDSKVVDENGEPLVVYHGSKAKGLTEFDKDKIKSGVGFWFTANKAAAEGHAMGVDSKGRQTRGDLVEAYLAIKNPARTPEEFDRGINAQGVPYDGYIPKGGDVFVAFEPTQIKSIFNRGTFNPKSGAILESVMPASSQSVPRSFREPDDSAIAALTNRNAPLFARVMEGGENALLPIRRKLQNAMADWKRVQDAIVDQTGQPLPQAMNVYRTETLYAGRTGERLEDFRTDDLLPLLEAMAERGVSFDDMNLYLYARHAPERNAYIATINPQMPDGGSGMTDAEAQGVMADFAQRGVLGDLQAVAGRADRILSETRRRLLREGIIDQDTFDQWTNQYQHYVPLRGFEAEPEDNTRLASGTRYDTRAKVALNALGRRSKADAPLAYIVAQAQQAIILGEKARVGRAVLRLARAYPNRNLWEVNQVVQKRHISEATGLVTSRRDGSKRVLADNVIAVRQGGNLYWVTIHHKGLLSGVKGTDAATMNAAFRSFAMLNRFFAMMRTQYDPQFFIPNFLRDLGTAGVHISADQGASILKDVVRDLPKAMKGAFLGSRQNFNSQWAQFYRDFGLAGGKVGVFGLKDIESIKRDIAADMRDAEGGAVVVGWKAVKAVGRFVGDVNGAIENAIRLSLYVNMRRRGFSQDDAGFAAKEVTINFNRKGEWSNNLNAAYMFFNAGVQGTARVALALARSKVARRFAYGLLLSGFAMDLLNSMLSGDSDDDGEDDYDQIPEHERERNLIIMWPGAEKGEYTKIPLPWVYNVFYYAGGNVSRAMRGKVKPGEASLNIVSAIAQAGNPLGSSNLVMMISPTVLDPLIELYSNKNWLGNPIMPEDKTGEKPKAESQRAFSTVSPVWKTVAEGLNTLTGGNEIRPGLIDISPEAIEHLSEFITGGVGQTLNQAGNVVGKFFSGEEIDVDRMPFWRKIAGRRTDYQGRQEYYTMREAVELTETELKRAAEEKDAQWADRVRKNYPADIKAIGLFKDADKAIKVLRKAAGAAPTNEARQKIEDQMNKLMTRVRKQYRRLRQDAGQE